LSVSIELKQSLLTPSLTEPARVTRRLHRITVYGAAVELLRLTWI